MDVSGNINSQPKKKLQRMKNLPWVRSLSKTATLFLRNKTGLVSIIVLLSYVVIAVFAGYIAPYSPTAIDLAQRQLPPSLKHLFGTDYFGHDVFSQIVFAIRLDLELAFLAVTIGYTIGVLAGVFAGYTGKFTDNAVMRVMDVFLAFPVLIFAVAIAIVVGEGFWAIVIAVSVTSIPGFSRIARSAILVTKNELYVTAAISQGASKAHILFRHVLPAAISPTIVFYALGLGSAILLSSGLSFLGVGIQPPTPELGAMIYQPFFYSELTDWWLVVFPGIFIVVIVIAFNMMGDTLREVTDVTLRR
ncbi:MAG: ABC transporter permease [Candidatus Thermoplasmatota archaeon]|jgi:peptide/nickel transport system permease protein|nr:ABC transporter permease [Candidatus Thermoplasmatota archaeon]